MSRADSEFESIILPKSHIYSLQLKEVWKYRDLLRMFVKRDFITFYKQTILGPLWFFIQPIFTTIIYVFVFGNIAEISTDGLPKLLFYQAGVTIWNYFSDCFSKISTVFVTNQGIFGKVYFPRLVTPLSIVVSNLLKFGIQFCLFLGIYSFFWMDRDFIQINPIALLTPLLLLLMAGLGLAFGLIVTSLTTKYRDLTFLLQFGIQLLMYASPVIYPLSSITSYKWLINLNPLTAILETFRYGWLGAGSFSWTGLGYSFLFMMISLFLGIIIFNRTEKSFVDNV